MNQTICLLFSESTKKDPIMGEIKKSLPKIFSLSLFLPFCLSLLLSICLPACLYFCIYSPLLLLCFFSRQQKRSSNGRNQKIFAQKCPGCNQERRSETFPRTYQKHGDWRWNQVKKITCLTIKYFIKCL